VYDIWPVWSPDGQQIAFTRVTEHASDVYLINADGSDSRAVLSGPEDELFLGWAPDGRRIAYRVTVEERISIRTLDLETGATAEVDHLPLDAMYISLSPDGRRIVYAVGRAMYLSTLDGSNPVLLGVDPDLLVNPVWSPDSQWIAFTTLADGTGQGLALLQPDSCEFALVEGLGGGLLSAWSREKPVGGER
jgi:Tol biopolymer transport system component